MIPVLFGAVCCAAVLFLVVAVRDSNRFVTVEYSIPCREVKKEYRFVLLSDLHNKEYGKGNRKLLEAVNALKPESVLIAGDMLTSSSSGNLRPAWELVEKLAAARPVYYAEGNHEYRMKTDPARYGGRYGEYREKLTDAGVVFLANESVLLPGTGIRIHGLELDRRYYKKGRKTAMDPDCLEKLLGPAAAEEYHILLAHNPDYFPEYARWGADLVLSGHVHGGIMRLPVLGGVISPSFHLFPRYDGGMFREGKSCMLLSRGLGSHTIPIRIFNPGELIAVRLLPDGGEECH